MKNALGVVLVVPAVLLVMMLALTTGYGGSAAATAVVAPAADPFAGRKIVDLTYAFNAETPFWPGDRYTPFKLETIATLEKDGVLSKAISLPEHLGTHLDAPNHFERHPMSVDKIPPGELMGSGVVLDIALKAEQDADAVLTLSDVRAWEARHGAIPPGAIVLLHTGWGRHWTNYSRYKNQDAQGKLHFPAYGADAARYLIHERKARGLGIDTLSIDPGTSPDFAVHHVVNAAGKYGLENVARLDELPPTGFHVLVAPMKIEHGTGGPTRIFAFLPAESP
jgi:kynurenine formamidase